MTGFLRKKLTLDDNTTRQVQSPISGPISRSSSTSTATPLFARFTTNNGNQAHQSTSLIVSGPMPLASGGRKVTSARQDMRETLIAANWRDEAKPKQSRRPLQSKPSGPVFDMVTPSEGQIANKLQTKSISPPIDYNGRAGLAADANGRAPQDRSAEKPLPSPRRAPIRTYSLPALPSSNLRCQNTAGKNRFRPHPLALWNLKRYSMPICHPSHQMLFRPLFSPSP